MSFKQFFKMVIPFASIGGFAGSITQYAVDFSRPPVTLPWLPTAMFFISAFFIVFSRNEIYDIVCLSGGVKHDP